jgi:Uma2 family endonuclease
MTTAARKLTYEDFARIPDDGFRHEIIEGEEFTTPAPVPEHQTVLLNVLDLVRSHVKARNLGKVFVAPTDVVLSEHDIVEPDLLFISSDRLSIVGPRNIQGAPDLVVEVTSPSTAALDRGPKLELYRRSGIREYWIVDPASRTVEIHEFGSPRRTRVYRDDPSFASAILPELTVRVADFF